MKYTRYYNNLIWTNHAVDRMKARGLSQDEAAAAFRSPDYRHTGKTNGAFEYKKYFGKKEVTVIGKQNERGQWIILSAWVNPPLPGSEDAKAQEWYRKYKQASFWKKLWLILLKQLGFFL